MAILHGDTKGQQPARSLLVEPLKPTTIRGVESCMQEFSLLREHGSGRVFSKNARQSRDTLIKFNHNNGNDNNDNDNNENDNDNNNEMKTETTIADERARLAETSVNLKTADTVDFFDHDEDQIKHIKKSSDDAKGDKENLFQLMYTMLMASSMVYTFAEIRGLARREGNLYEGFWPFRRKIEISVKKPELVLTKGHNGGVSEFGESNNLKRKIVLNDLATFIDLNLDLFEKSPEIGINTEKGDAMNTLVLLEKAKMVDGDLREFDDRFDETQLVYGILVNHNEKRVTVVFRGSVFGGKDWSTNLQASVTKLETPAKLAELDFKEELKVHAGFKAYLIDKTPAGDNEEKKYKRIIQNLEDIFKEFKDYKLCVTGHSLGGALCSLLAFKIAASGDLPDVQRPIEAVSFAAPQVGPAVFNRAYQILEREGLIRHLRVSNQGDVVPVAPPFPFNEPLNPYTQNGVNIHFLRWGRTMQVGYRNLKSFFSQSSMFPVRNHTLKLYLTRMMQNSEKLKSMTFQSFFDDKKITRGFSD